MTAVPKGKKHRRIRPKKSQKKGRKAEDTKHRNMLRKMACCLCGSWVGVTWHHLLRIDKEYLAKFPERWGHSMGKRAHDFWTIPVCTKCHSEIHDKDGNEKRVLGRWGVIGEQIAVQLAGLTLSMRGEK